MIGDRPCGLYAPGHQVHFIQARKAAGDAGAPVEVVDVVEQGVVLAAAGGLRVVGNHDPRRVFLLAQGHPEVVLVERWGILRIGGGSVRKVFSVAPDAPPERRCG